MTDDQSDEIIGQTSTRRRALKLAGGSTTAMLLGTAPATAQAEDRRKWTFETVGQAASSPTVVNKTVYIGSNDTNLYAIDIESGDEKWRFQTGASITSSPNVVDGTAYIGSEDSRLYAVDAETGNQKWRSSLFAPDEIDSSPTVKDGTVFVGNDNGTLYAANAVTGDRKWIFQRSNEIESSPTVANGSVYIGINDDGLYSLNAENGDQEWYFETDVITSSPTVTGDRVLIGGDQKIHSVNATSGESEGSADIPGVVQSTPTVYNNTVFISSDFILAIDDAANVQWRFDAASASSPTAADGTVFVGAIDNNLYSLDAETGDEQWAYDVGSEIRLSSPTVVDGTVYVGSQGGTVHAIDTDIAGSSEDSRVNLGTLGHTDNWARKAGSLSVSYDNPTANSGLLKVSQQTYLIEGRIKTSETTNLPTDVEVRVTNSDAAIRQGTIASVSQNGSFSAEFDLSGAQVGDEFQTSVRNSGDIIDETDSILVETNPLREVELRNINLSPSVVDGTNPTHTLSFEVINLSPDNNKDTFSITLPSNVNIDEASFTDKGGLNPEPEDPTPENPISFSVNPSDATQADMEIELSLSPTGD